MKTVLKTTNEVKPNWFFGIVKEPVPGSNKPKLTQFSGTCRQNINWGPGIVFIFNMKQNSLILKVIAPIAISNNRFLSNSFNI